MKYVRLVILKVLFFVIKSYQYGISPLFPMACRYHPTCSQYMIISIQESGIIKGTMQGIRRILSCHPWGKND
jgi:putative membrane protein insertion efficiency factor